MTLKSSLCACIACCLLSVVAASDASHVRRAGYLYGTQYYRSPTPLPNEWEHDLASLEVSNLDVIQLRINWRNNERKEDEYRFEDIDRLMDLAEKYDRKVIIKFLLECAPQYVFDRYGGTRIGPKGELIRGGSHGAFYAGGWLPCFTNPKVRERAARFVEQVAKRYAGRPSLVMWNAWNEPRNKPVEECFCPECRKAFGDYLRGKYGTIEKLNAHYGVAEESFEGIALPAMAKGYWDIYEFKLFKSQKCIYDNLRMVYEAVRRHDGVRPVISHVGCTSGFQNDLGDCCDDFEVSKAVDRWGTSLPCFTKMEKPENRLDYNRLNDFLRSIDPQYYLYEIYPGLGMYWDEYDSPWDMSYKLSAGLGAGAKGFNFWQYRSERVGMENDCAGLVRADGTPRPVLSAVRDFGACLDGLPEGMVRARSKPAQIAILFDYPSSLMSRIEDAALGPNYAFGGSEKFHYYGDAHKGFYNMLKRNDYPVDYVNMGHVEQILGYRVVYVPDCELLPASAVPVLERFVESGGLLIADEGFGLRDANTWINPYDIKCGKLGRLRVAERRYGERTVRVGKGELKALGFQTEFEIGAPAESVVTFADGHSAVSRIAFGEGATCFCGFGLGYTAARGDAEKSLEVFRKLTDGTALATTPYGRFAADIEERRLVGANCEYVVLINTGDKTRRVVPTEQVLSVYPAASSKGGSVELPPRQCVVVIVAKRRSER